MKYLFLKIEIIATSLVLALIVISTAPAKSIALWWDLEFFDAQGTKVGDGEFRYDLNSEKEIEYQGPLENESIVIDFSYNYDLLSESLFHDSWQLKRVSFNDFIWWRTQFSAVKQTATLVSVRTVYPYNKSSSQSSFSQSKFVDLSLPIKASQIVPPQPFELDFQPVDNLEQPQEFEGTWTANLRTGDVTQLDLVDMPVSKPTKDEVLNPEPLAIVSFIVTTMIGIFLRKSSQSDD